MINSLNFYLIRINKNLKQIFLNLQNGNVKWSISIYIFIHVYLNVCIIIINEQIFN